MVLFQLPESLWKCLLHGQKKVCLKPIQWSLVYGLHKFNLYMYAPHQQFSYKVSTKENIGIIFSLVSPLILPVGLVLFGLFLVVHSYQAIYVLETNVKTAGLLYWEALNHQFVGTYTMNLFLIGLFILRNAIGPTILAAFLFVGVALVQKYV